MIYLDHAATSWPKPPAVLRAMAAFLENAGGNPGRSGHRLSIAAGRVLYDAREAVADLFHLSDPTRVIFTANATHALNLVLRGLLRPGERVLTTAVEHNAVMRPLRALEREGVILSVVPAAWDGSIDLDAVRRLIPGTRLVVATHANNVTGTILPIAEIAALAHSASALLLVDAAQTAGVLDIDVPTSEIDLLAFTGHKGLYGPPGTGGLVLGTGVAAGAISPLMRGGTGSRSESEEQPEDLPDKFEGGTPNGVGIAGLGAGVRFVLDRGVDAIRVHEVEMITTVLHGLQDIPGIRVYGPTDARLRTAVVSFTVDGWHVSDLGLRLDEEHGVLCRVGLHCAPATHRTIGSFPTGTVRLAPGIFTTRDQVETAVAAVRKVVGG
jgi:cysteine desulfurase family protein